MKYKLMYSPDARDKLKKLNKQISSSNGKIVADKIVEKIMVNIRGLRDNPKKGASVESMIGIPTPYRFLHIEHNYV